MKIFKNQGHFKYDGIGNAYLPEEREKMKKKVKQSTSLVKKVDFTLADIGAIVLRDAEETVRLQITNTIRSQAEAVLGRILYFKKKIEEDKFYLSEFERKAKAIQDGEFSVNKYDGSIAFNDPTLEKLG